MIISALSVPVISPTHDHGRWDDHDRGRSHDDRHPDAHGDTDPRVGGQRQRETRESQDRDDTPHLPDRVETLHSYILLLMHQCGFA
jgi:hypothetical protein